MMAYLLKAMYDIFLLSLNTDWHLRFPLRPPILPFHARLKHRLNNRIHAHNVSFIINSCTFLYIANLYRLIQRKQVQYNKCRQLNYEVLYVLLSLTFSTSK